MSKENPKYCESCGRLLRMRIVRKHNFDTETGKRHDYHMVYWYCLFGLFFGFIRNDGSVRHDNFTNANWVEDK